MAPVLLGLLAFQLSVGEKTPTGMRITPTAAPGSVFETLNPDLPARPDWIAGQPVTTAVSPDGRTLLVLTSGYNRVVGPTGSRIADQSREYVFVFDLSGGQPVKRQVLAINNTHTGLAWAPDGRSFYVSGGVDDRVYVYSRSADAWAQDGAPIALGGHQNRSGYYSPMVAGLAVTADGRYLLAANLLYDSVSVVDLNTRIKAAEVDLRPGRVDPAAAGVPGGSYPYWIAVVGNRKAYVSSQRDHDLVVLELLPVPRVAGRIALGGGPNRMALNKAQTLLFVAQANHDSIAVIDTASDTVAGQFASARPLGFLPRRAAFKGHVPNSVALSPDEDRLYVTNGGTNNVAVIGLRRLANGDVDGNLEGLIPTGFYPSSVSVSADGKTLYVVNSKSNAGPNPEGSRGNQYSLQLLKGGLLTLPVPPAPELPRLTRQVAVNASDRTLREVIRDEIAMAAVREQVRHVIYIVKENRTYDQLFGDLPRGNGDPALAILGPYAPNHRKIALDFVLLDNFYDPGSVSGDGWNWSTAGRATDFVEKSVPLNYAGRGTPYDYEGTNRGVIPSLPTAAERKRMVASYPDDPDLLPGGNDVSAPDSADGEVGAGYLWDAVLRSGLTLRNYGFFVVNTSVPAAQAARLREPFRNNDPMCFPAKPALADHTDLFFRGYDLNNADYWLFKEWEREFDEYAGNGNLPNLMMIRLPHDHFGNFTTAIDGVNTVEAEMSDNDYAVGLIMEKVARSPYKDNTLIFVVEDDAQNGNDHVDAHRSIALVAGPFVKKNATVSTHYTTVNLLRTILDVLGADGMGLNDALAEPMAAIFEPTPGAWDYTAIVPEVLRGTRLPLPAATPSNTQRDAPSGARRSAEYWQRAMGNQNFEVEDKLDADAFNRALWSGLAEGPYPEQRHGRDLSLNREELLRRLRYR